MKPSVGLAICILLCLGACDDSPNKAREYLDGSRLKAEAETYARAWLKHAPDANGYFKTRFTRSWSPAKGNTQVTLVAQSRLLFVLAAGYDLTGDARFKEAVQAGGQFLVTQMRNRGNRGWFASVDMLGKPVRTGVHVYGYSFAIFGLSHAYRVTGDQAFLQAAMDTWLTDVWPGLSLARQLAKSPLAGSKSKPRKGAWSQNAFMHLFEALLALHDVGHSAEIWSDIEAMAAFVESRLVQRCGCIPEWYDARSFKPLDDTGDGFVELGHQVEWAYLLSRAVEMGLDRRYKAVADRLMQFAIKNGLEEGTGALYARSKYSGQVRSQEKVWWAQAELMRAAVHFAAWDRQNDYWPVYQKAHDFAHIHFVDQEFGGWTGESFVASGKSGDQLEKVIGYHAIAFYLEALSHVTATPREKAG